MTLAARQHGLVTRRQLLDAGLTPHRIDHRVATTRLRPVQRGIYQVGPRWRDAELSAMGFRVIRVTWRQVVKQPEVVLVWVAQTLARAHPREHDSSRVVELKPPAR